MTTAPRDHRPQAPDPGRCNLTCPSAQPMFEDAQVPGEFEGKGDVPRLSCNAGTLAAAEEVVASTGPVPPCAIRQTCRWYAQAGAPACHRCPQVVTRPEHPDVRLAAIAEGPSVGTLLPLDGP